VAKPLQRFRLLGIRAQLTLWYTIVFAILILLFGTVFYVNLHMSLVSSFDDALRLRTQQIAAGIAEENGKITISDVTGGLPGIVDGDEVKGAATAGHITPARHRETHPDVVFGALVSITQPLHGASWKGTITARNGQSVRLYSAALIDNGKVFGVAQVGESLASLDTTLHSVLVEFLLIVPFVLLLSAFGSYWLATNAFAPIKRLTRAARRIKDGDLQQRVPVPLAKDEVQSLALTFNEMIERLNKAFMQQRRFAADASHELRTPVAAIRSMTDVVLAQDAAPEEYVTVLREVNNEAERLGHLITDLMALAHADEGLKLFEREPVRLDLLAADVAATTEPLAAERGITLEVDNHEPAIVMGDEARLIQVIMNLLANAITYTNAGGKVKLSVQVKHNGACLTVRDTGIGIAPEHLPHIFERFYRADPARSTGHSGLGLAIVDWVVHAHGGAISVESQVGQGTAFIVALPLADQAHI